MINNNSTFKFKKSKIIIFFILLGLIFISYSIGRFNREDVLGIETQGEPFFSKKPKMEFTKQNLAFFMKKIRIKFPETVYAQAKLESGNFKSFLFKTHNNLFGMKYAKSRITLGNKTNGEYAHYAKWDESVIDYAIHQTYFLQKHKITNKAQFYSYLSKYYAEDSLYIYKLQKIENEYYEIIKNQKL